ncbi:MAG: hypothetical protein H6907_16820 [Hyphomicrobiales bacterium]|nr:hypothetical protein [Hyphomicrobiales bacterium]
MQVLMLLNGLGVVAAAALTGLLAARGLFPLGSVVAGLLFLFGAFFPFFHEYGIVRRGFQRLEGQLLTRLRRPFQPRPEVEIFQPGAAAPEPVWRQRRDPIWLLLFLTSFAGFLFLFDLVEYLPELLSAAPDSRPITNF